MRRTEEVLCRRDLKLIDTMWKDLAISGGEMLLWLRQLCVLLFFLYNRDAAACVTMAMAVLHLGSPGADDQSAEETQSGPLRSAGRWASQSDGQIQTAAQDGPITQPQQVFFFFLSLSVNYLSEKIWGVHCRDGGCLFVLICWRWFFSLALVQCWVLAPLPKRHATFWCQRFQFLVFCATLTREHLASRCHRTFFHLLCDDVRNVTGLNVAVLVDNIPQYNISVATAAQRDPSEICSRELL